MSVIQRWPVPVRYARRSKELFTCLQTRPVSVKVGLSCLDRDQRRPRSPVRYTRPPFRTIPARNASQSIDRSTYKDCREINNWSILHDPRWPTIYQYRERLYLIWCIARFVLKLCLFPTMSLLNLDCAFSIYVVFITNHPLHKTVAGCVVSGVYTRVVWGLFVFVFSVLFISSPSLWWYTLPFIGC